MVSTPDCGSGGRVRLPASPQGFHSWTRRGFMGLLSIVPAVVSGLRPRKLEWEAPVLEELAAPEVYTPGVYGPWHEQNDPLADWWAEKMDHTFMDHLTR